MSPRAYLAARDGGTEIRLKVVPGASRSALAGTYGDRLRVRVSAPPEGGKANRAVCALLAARLGVPVAKVRITAGTTTPRKTVFVEGRGPDAVAASLD